MLSGGEQSHPNLAAYFWHVERCLTEPTRSSAVGRPRERRGDVLPAVTQDFLMWESGAARTSDASGGAFGRCSGPSRAKDTTSA